MEFHVKIVFLFFHSMIGLTPTIDSQAENSYSDVRQWERERHPDSCLR